MDLKLLKEIDKSSKKLVVERTIGLYESSLIDDGVDIEHPIVTKLIDQYHSYLIAEMGDELDYVDDTRGSYGGDRALGATGEIRPGTANKFASDDLEGAGTAKGAGGIGLGPGRRQITPKDVERGNASARVGGKMLAVKRFISPELVLVGDPDPNNKMLDQEVEVKALFGPVPDRKTGGLIWIENPKKAAQKGQMM